MVETTLEQELEEIDLMERRLIGAIPDGELLRGVWDEYDLPLDRITYQMNALRENVKERIMKRDKMQAQKQEVGKSSEINWAELEKENDELFERNYYEWRKKNE